MSVLNFFQIRIENTNACGYKCKICPREKLTRRIGVMSVEDFLLALERVTPFEGIFHLHGFGEPLLDKNLPQKIRLLKERFPTSKAQIISTLGVNVKEDYFFKLADAGLDDIMISLYGNTKEDYQTVHGYDGFDLVKHNLQLLSNVLKMSKPSLSCYVKLMLQPFEGLPNIQQPMQALQFVKWVHSLGVNVIESDEPHNYGDGRKYNIPKSEKTCPIITGMRRHILHITWDLNVVPCCYDYNSSICFGNLRENTLDEIFSSPSYLSFLKAHKTGDLSKYPICLNCEKNDFF